MELRRLLLSFRALHGAFIISLAWAGCALAAPDDAQVILVVGKAEVREAEGGEWKPVTVRQQLPAGASVRTGDASQMALLLKDQTQIRINQHSTLKFQSAVEPGQETTLDLLNGRIWAQVKWALYGITGALTKRQVVRLRAPTATIGVRGTDWDVEVAEDGKTTVTVLSGEVEMANQFGSVNVGPNEQASAEVGQPPIKRLLSDARDRVQWVTAYRPTPRRWVKTPPAALLPAVTAIESGDYGLGLKLLEAESGSSLEARLLLADIYLFLGRANDAIALLAPLSRDGQALAVALQGRALAVAGRLDEARELLLAAVARHPGEIDVALALADVARLQGNADEALRLFAEVAAAQPGSHEAWFGIGRIDNEKEDLKPARGALDTAIRLAPDAPGYHGELATLEVLSGDYAAARNAFDEALRRQPDDYLAWTGLGILQLKMGHSEAALESFLKAGVLEPRFARAQLYTGVAYYRLENTRRAIEALNKAAELDPKDPLPYVMLGLIHGDALELRAATDAARQAQVRMPFLKSLNPISVNQKGSANVGSALAAQGMEEWARAYASSSYNPFWAGSALFLADRYPAGFNSNSELYKGYLLDPTVFGASNRFSSLVRMPGHYGSVGYFGARGDFSQSTLQTKLNGLTDTSIPFAYSITGEYADGHETLGGQNTFQVDVGNLTVGLGAKLSHDLSVFYFGTNSDVHGHFSDPTVLPDAPLAVKVTRQDAGIGYRVDPTNQIWFLLGDGRQATRLSGSQVDAANAAGLSIGGTPPLLTTSAAAQLNRNDVNVTQSEVHFRQTFEPARGTRLTWGYEDAHNQLALDRDQTFSSTLCTPGCVVTPTTLNSAVGRDLKSSGLYVSVVQAVGQNLDVQLDLNHQETRANESVAQTFGILGASLPLTSIDERASFYELNHRLGVRFSPETGKDLRLAYQRWRRPFGAGSLGPTETAGIAVEDRMVAPGGLLSRTKARFDWELGDKRFIQLYADHRQVTNLQSSAAGFFRQFGLTELEALRPRKPIFDQAFDELEDTPFFGQGKVTSGGAAINWLMTDDVAVAARYINSSSKNTGAAFAGNAIPFIPRHFLNLSAFWQVGGRWLASGVANYRSQRYKDRDEANTLPLDAGWNFGLRAYWESLDKRWSVEAAAINLHSDKDSALVRRAQLVLNSIYRF